MEYAEIISFFNKYGLAFFFCIVFLEYLNLPGFPGGVIFPLAGIWLTTTGKAFIPALFISVVAGLAGSLLLYLAGKKGGPMVLEKIKQKYPSQRTRIDDYTHQLRCRANYTVFFAKLLPVLRTIIGLPAGMIGMHLGNYLFFSGLGILVWNGALMLVGVYFGDWFLNR